MKKNIIFEHISNNQKEYILILLMLVIGIFAGVFFVNNIDEAQGTEITSYFSTSIQKIKDSQGVQPMNVLKNSISANISFGILLWFLGTTIIGMPIVFGIIAYRGFCLGYTISASVLALGSVKGTIFTICALMLHNIIFIPAIVAIGVSRIEVV